MRGPATSLVARLAAVVPHTARSANVSAAWATASFPGSVPDGVVRDGMTVVIAVCVQQLGDRSVVLCREECPLSDLVMTPSKECSDPDLLAAATPAGACWDQSRALRCAHVTKIPLLDEAARRLIKNTVNRSRARRPINTARYARRSPLIFTHTRRHRVLNGVPNGLIVRRPIPVRVLLDFVT
jgi:hypothetical protein